MSLPPVTGFDAVRLLLTLGFRIGTSNGSEAAMERSGCTVFVPEQGELSEGVVAALMGAAHIDPCELRRLLGLLASRDTLPDLGERAV